MNFEKALRFNTLLALPPLLNPALVKTPTDIPSTPQSFTAAAEIISTVENTSLTRQGLTDYITRHGLPTVKVGKRRKVHIAPILAHRQNFTREVMSGQHIKAAAPQNPAPQNPAPQNPSPKPDPDEPTSLDLARDAKARKEFAQADRAELDLAKQKEDLISAPAAEAAAGSAMMSAKSYFLGPALGETADGLITALNLPESAKREIEPVLDATFRELLNRFSKTMIEEFGGLNTSFAAGLPSRLDILTHHAASLRAMNVPQLVKELAAHG